MPEDIGFKSDLPEETLEECVAICRYLEKTVGEENPDKLPSARDIFENRKEIFSKNKHEDATYDSFRKTLNRIFKKISEENGLFQVGLYVYNGLTKIPYNVFENIPDKAKGATHRFGLSQKLKEERIPEMVGQLALASLTCFQILQKEMCMPSLCDLNEVITTLEDFFYAKDAKGGNLNPYSAARGKYGKIDETFMVFKGEGRSLRRKPDSDDKENQSNTPAYQEHFTAALNCFRNNELVEIEYVAASKKLIKILLDPVICVTLVKNGSVYIIGPVWDHLHKAYRKDMVVGDLYVQTCKLDRIIKAKRTGLQSTLSMTDRNTISHLATSNDGAYITKPKFRFDAIIKVSPRYHYYDESVPFVNSSADTELDDQQLSLISQPVGSRCFLIEQTNMEHLINEVIKSRGNIIVLAPPFAVEKVKKEITMMSRCQDSMDPLNIAKVDIEEFDEKMVNNAHEIRTIHSPPEDSIAKLKKSNPNKPNLSNS